MAALTPQDLRAAFFKKPWVRIKNETGADLLPFSVCRITNTELSYNNELIYNVGQPDTTFHGQYIVHGPFRAGFGNSDKESFGTFLFESGFVRYDTTGWTPAIGDFSGPKNGQMTLAKNYYGFYSTGIYTTVLGLPVLVAKQVGIPYVHGKIDGASVSLTGTATVSIWDKAWAGDIGVNISAENHAVALTGTTNKKCGVAVMGVTGELTWAAC